MILLSSPLKMTPPPPGNHDKHLFFLEIEIVITKIVNSKSLKKICGQLLSAMNILKAWFSHKSRKIAADIDLRQSDYVKDDCSTPKLFCFFKADFLSWQKPLAS